MSLFAFQPVEVSKIHGAFSEQYCLHCAPNSENVQSTIKSVPFSRKRDFSDIQLLYPAWTSRELAINKNPKSELSKLWLYDKYESNFVTFLSEGEIVCILGFVPVHDEKKLELIMVSGKKLKKIWSHKFCKLINKFISCLYAMYPDCFLLSSCDAECPIYSKFVEKFNFNYWSDYSAFGRLYRLYIFKPI